MNRTIARALLDDAFHQVLDNRIFRLLLLVVLGLVAPTFLIGCRENDVQILWGWQELSYADLYSWVGRSTKSVKDVQGTAIQGYQKFVVDGLCSSVGMIFCVAATAFFVPRMLEKGSADVLFSKPLSRTTLLLARYFSGLLFVGILATTLVVGMCLGFLVVSGYWDTGFLWGALTLVYLFAIVHGVATLAGVATRSTVAAILIALVFFIGTGCVHQVWRFRGFFEETAITDKQRRELATDGDAAVPAILDSQPGVFVRLLIGTLETLHYTLPKTSDADLITRKLRKAIARERAVLVDETVHLSLPETPDGFDLQRAPAPASPGSSSGVDLSNEKVAWSSADPPQAGFHRFEVSRRTRIAERPGGEDGSAQRRPRRSSANSAADEIVERLKARATGDLAGPPSKRRADIDGGNAVIVDWTETSPAPGAARQTAIFTLGDWIIEVEATGPATITADRRAEDLDTFLGGFRVARETDAMDPTDWYERRFGWSAELPFNAFFSIGSSILFTLAALGLAAWKLKRIDF